MAPLLRGEGRSGGALTVVNAIPAGRGAALGLALKTEAEVELVERPGPVTVTIEEDPAEDPRLATACLEVVGEHVDRPLSGAVRTRSDIPIARGLKSSSAAANAIVLAALDATGTEATPEEVLTLSVAAARRAGVTATGALDDAAASLLGGLVVTDNREDRVLLRKSLERDLRVLLLVPRRKRYTSSAVQPLRALAPLSHALAERAEAGAWERALTVNGLAVAAALGEPVDPVYRALHAGALAAGMSGTGPAVGAVCDERAFARVGAAWGIYDADLLLTRTTNGGGP